MNGRTSVHASGLATLAVLGFLFSAGVASYLTQPAIAFVQPRPGNHRAPARLSVQVRVPRHADNRWIGVSWNAEPCEDDLFGCEDRDRCEAGSFMVQVDGADADTILPYGERIVTLRTRCPYRFSARLIGVGDRLRGAASVKVWVR